MPRSQVPASGTVKLTVKVPFWVALLKMICWLPYQVTPQQSVWTAISEALVPESAVSKVAEPMIVVGWLALW